jgi:LEA14-like dessication related protein
MNPVLLLLGIGSAIALYSGLKNASESVRLLLTGATVDTSALLAGQFILNIRLEALNQSQTRVGVQRINAELLNNDQIIATADTNQAIELQPGQRTVITIPVRFRSEAAMQLSAGTFAGGKNAVLNATITTGAGQIKTSQDIDLTSFLPAFLRPKTSAPQLTATQQAAVITAARNQIKDLPQVLPTARPALAPATPTPATPAPIRPTIAPATPAPLTPRPTSLSGFPL